MDALTFLRRFKYTEGLQAICVGSVEAQGFFTDPPAIPSEKDVFFGPAMRRTPGNTKDDVLGTVAFWVDADDPQRPLFTFPPSIAVFSGHGWHLYWFVTDPVEEIDHIEKCNKLLAEDVPTGDKATWNANRVLRVPNTTNNKDPSAPIRVEIRMETTATYQKDDFLVLEKLPKAARHKIRTGDSRGYRSRSERDWAIVTDLVDAGASDALIELLFAKQPCGDKTKDAPEDYLRHTIEKARERSKATGGSPAGQTAKGFLEERAEGYFVYSRRGSKQVSTFTIQPKVLLDGSDFGQEDAIVGAVQASGYLWDDVTFSRSAFTSVSKLDRECPVAAWQWLGRDEEVRMVLPHLLQALQDKGLPKVAATSVLGLHFRKSLPYFIGNAETLSAKEVWAGYNAPVAWLPSKREHPELALTPGEFDQAMLAELPLLNDLGAIMPMIGWYSAAPLKVWLEANGYRFPVLNVVGTRGSGKTTLIQRVFMPLFGQTDPKSYDSGTTRFVTLALMGSSNGVPVAFSEFRYESVEKFIRFILLAYDTGHDPRGRSDQTTVDYPLSAPFSVDGEDMIEDPAARERIIVAHLHPDSISEGTESYLMYNKIRSCLPKNFAGTYIQTALQLIESGDLLKLLMRARESMFEAFPSQMPDRVRANHTVAYFGTLLWCKVLGIEAFDPLELRQSISLVYNIDAGRSRTLADSLIEDVVNACAGGTSQFKWKASPEGNSIFFQLSSAHSWWLASRRRQGRGALERDAIRAQLKESPYMADSKVIDNTWMCEVVLPEAQEFGLDIPSVVNSREFKVHF